MSSETLSKTGVSSASPKKTINRLKRLRNKINKRRKVTRKNRRNQTIKKMMNNKVSNRLMMILSKTAITIRKSAIKRIYLIAYQCTLIITLILFPLIPLLL